MKALSLILVFLFLSACTTLNLKPTPCFIYAPDMAICTPQSAPSYDKQLDDMIGYTAFSPKDTNDLKILIHKGSK